MEHFFETNTLLGQFFEIKISKCYREQVGLAENSDLPMEFKENSSGEYTIFCTNGKLRVHLHIEHGEDKKYKVYNAYRVNSATWPLAALASPLVEVTEC